MSSVRRAFWLVVHRAVIVLAVVVTLLPIYWMAITSLKNPREVIRPVPTLFPQAPTLENYVNVFSQGIWGNFYNTVVIAVAATGVSIVLAFLASYALSRHRFPLRFNRIFLVWVLLVRILPPIVLAAPLFALFSGLGLVNSRLGLVVAFQVYTLPYAIWIIYGFIQNLPRDYEEAATIDGASPGRILLSVVLPLVRPGILATSIFSLILAWNEFLFALLLVRTPRLLTLPVVIARFIGEYTTQWGELMAIGLMASLPILLFSRVVYRQLTEGFSLSLK